MYTDEEKEQLAINTIRNYLNKDFTDEEIKTKFGLALKRIINNFDTMTSSTGVKSMKQGSMSVTYTDETLVYQRGMDKELLLDVDGECGGFNLGFAWISGYLAGKSLGDNHD